MIYRLAWRPSNTRKVNVPVADSAALRDRIASFVIDPRFCGPPESANGGYTCGRLAHFIDGQATVRLIKPPPLGVSLDVVQNGPEVELYAGSELVAKSRPGGQSVEPPPAPTLEAARARRAHYAGVDDFVFPTCFVCGIAREEGDGLCIYAGPDPQGDPRHVACTWTPHKSFCEEGDTVAEHFVWAALDCPSGWAFLGAENEVALLGEFSAHIEAPLHCGQEYIVAGWEIAQERRKRLTASAIYSAEGQLLAYARATWIVIPSA